MPKLCIIPARGGSKRIPKKNIKDFLGKPILAYSIETALESKLFDEVMVSTDDFEIAEIAKKLGAKVPFYRSKELSDDYAGISEVLLEVLDKYQKEKLVSFELTCCIYPTSVFTTIEQLKLGFEYLINNVADTVIPIVKYDYPIWRGFNRDQQGFITYLWDEYIDARSQDLEEVFHDSGQWALFNTSSFLKNKSVISERTMSVVISSLEAQDIDCIEDWKVAEQKYRLLKGI